MAEASGCAGAAGFAPVADLAPKAEPKAEPVVDDTVWIVPTASLSSPCRVEVNPAPSTAELYYKNERPDIVRKDCLIIKSLYVEPEAHMEGPSAHICGVNVTITRVSDDRFLVVATSPFFVYVTNATISIYPMTATIPSTLPAWISTTLTVVGPPGRMNWACITCNNAVNMKSPADRTRPANLVKIDAACLARSVLLDMDMTSMKVVGHVVLSVCSVRARGPCFVKVDHMVSGALHLHCESTAKFTCKRGRIGHTVVGAESACRVKLPNLVNSLTFNVAQTSVMIAKRIPQKLLYRVSIEKRRVKLNTTTSTFEYFEE